MSSYPRDVIERQIGRPGEGRVDDTALPPEPIEIVDPDPAWDDR